MANRNRPVQVNFRCTQEERDMIDKRMAQTGTMNMGAYLRKMAIDGYVVKLELPELRDAVSVFRRESNNINQITKRVNSTGRVYDVDVRAVQESLDRQWAAMNVVLEKLASIP